MESLDREREQRIEWRDFAERTARAAGDEVLQIRQRREVRVAEKKFHEMVTSADLRSDEMIRAAIRSRYPGDRMLTEESIRQDVRDVGYSGTLWVVDPIDGTVNFAYGLPGFAVSIAVALDGAVQAGAVYAPALGLSFAAARGEGATLNDAPIHAGSPPSLASSLVSTGFPYDRAQTDHAIRRMALLARSCRDVRRMGAAAIDICRVGAGLLDAHVETLSPWDIAAAGLIAREAGAVMAHLRGVPAGVPAELCGDEVLYAAPSIAEELLQLMRREA